MAFARLTAQSIGPGTTPFHIQRMHGDADPVRLKNWVTIDPRKNRIPRYQYEGAIDPGEHAIARNPRPRGPRRTAKGWRRPRRCRQRFMAP